MIVTTTTVVVTLDEQTGTGRALLTTSLIGPGVNASRVVTLSQAELDQLEFWLTGVTDGHAS